MTLITSPAIVRAASLERDPLKKNFKNFMYKTWMTLFDNAPTATMYDIGDQLQHGPDRDIVMGFRGLSKSYITVDFAVWALYCDPAEIVLTTSGSGDGAKGNATLAYGMINGFDWLSHMKPRGTDRSSAQAFDVAGSRHEKSESFAAMSLFGQLTGRRASLIIPDDVETPNTSATESDRNELRRRYAELGGAILKPGGKIKVLGTAQTENTLYTELATQRGYGLTIYPVVYPRPSVDPAKDEVKKYGPWLSKRVMSEVQANPHLAGTSVEPTRFDEADLDARRLEYGSVEFDRQFRLFLDAGAGNTQPLKIRDIPVLEIPLPPIGIGGVVKVPSELTWSPIPQHAYQDITVDALNGDSTVYAPLVPDGIPWQSPEGIILIVDPSGGGSDETAWGILAQHLGRVFLLHHDARLEGFSDATLEAIAADAARFRVTKVWAEKNYGGGMFGSLLKPHLMDAAKASQGAWEGCSIEEENAGQVQKEVRIVDTLQAVVTGHRLVIAAETLRKDYKAGTEYASVEQAKKRNYRLTYQMTRVTKQKGCLPHDDRIDMVASGVAKFIGVLRRQLEEAARENKDLLMAQEVEKLIESRKKQGLSLFGMAGNWRSRLGEFKQSAEGLNSSPLFKGRKR